MTWLRLWNWAGGGIPGGPAILLGLLLGWPALLYLVVRPTGVFRDRSPLPWLVGGWMVLLALHVQTRLMMTPPVAPERILLWPPEAPLCPDGAGVFMKVEQELRRRANRGELNWNDRKLKVSITQHMLDQGRFQPDRAEDASRLMQAMGVSLMTQLAPAGQAGTLRLWRQSWGQCTLDESEPCSEPANPDTLQAALHRLLQRALGEWPAQLTAWDLRWAPLYQVVTDSAALWIDLPEGLLPPWEDLRRTDLMLALGAQPTEIVAGLNRALALADTLAAHGTAAAPEADIAAASGAEPWLLAARWFAVHEQWDQARQALGNALSREADHPLIYWQLAHMAPSKLETFGYKDRASVRARCLALQPAFIPALLQQATHWSDYRRHDLAIPATDAALTAYPNHAELHLLRANLAYEVLDFSTALKHYQRCASLTPGDPRVWINLGQMHYVSRQWPEAVRALEQAVVLGSPPHVLHLLGMCHLSNGRRDLAIEYFRRRMSLGGTREEMEETRIQLQALFPGGPPEDSLRTQVGKVARP